MKMKESEKLAAISVIISENSGGSAEEMAEIMKNISVA
jgi:hypothetical protein